MKYKYILIIISIALLAIAGLITYLVLNQDVQQNDKINNEQIEEMDLMINIQIGDRVLTATLVDNSSTRALINLLNSGPIKINMRDYAGMEKVGNLPESLPRNDQPITAEAGDLILYLGNAFVIYYDNNSWNFTRLGKINDVSNSELRSILGAGNVSVTLSLIK